jgi:outer membrane murein-binding lipoprotein Lpp
MSEAVIVAVIIGGLSFAGVVTTNLMTAKKNETALKVSQAVTETKLEGLRTELNRHNNLIERTYKLEGQMEEVRHDIQDLKAYHKPKL